MYRGLSAIVDPRIGVSNLLCSSLVPRGNFSRAGCFKMVSISKDAGLVFGVPDPGH